MDSDEHPLLVKKFLMKALTRGEKHEIQSHLDMSEVGERHKSQVEIKIRMSSNKKYSSIGEVIKLLNIQAHQLRYLENTLPNLAVHKIRNRRYYTDHDIAYLRSHLAESKSNKEQPIVTKSITNRMHKIDQLINKFLTLSDNINKLINNTDKENRTSDHLHMKQMSFKGCQFCFE